MISKIGNFKNGISPKKELMFGGAPKYKLTPHYVVPITYQDFPSMRKVFKASSPAPAVKVDTMQYYGLPNLRKTFNLTLPLPKRKVMNTLNPEKTGHTGKDPKDKPCHPNADSAGRQHVGVLTKLEIDPLLFRRGNISLQIPVPLFFLKKSKRSKNTRQIHPLIKRSGVITYSSYPQCFTLAEKLWPLLGRYETPERTKHKWKRHIVGDVKRTHRGLPAEVPYWPLLGPIKQVYPEENSGNVFRGAKVSLATVLDSKKNWQMDLVRRISEMKAKEHLAEENRQTQLHRTQEAKRDFQERICDQMSLLSDAKRADLRAREAFKKVVGYERGLAEEDKEIHRLKEAEDELYQELLESEAEVAMADMEVIPKLVSEEDLQNFLSGTRFIGGRPT